MKTHKTVLAGLLTGMFIGIGCAAFGQNTNPPQFLSIRKTPDTAAVLNWASDPLTIYRVEYSTTLTTGSWQVAQENFPSQGTNTLWTDTGREASFSPRLSSAEPDEPYRFYRLAVERYMSNTSPITVTIDNHSDGAVISSLVSVQGSASAAQGIASAKLYVDGDVVDAESGNAYIFPLESRYYPNGTHRLSVVAMDAGGFESTEQEVAASSLLATYASKNIDVNFDNFLSNVHFSHRAFRPDLGQTQHISATWSSPRLWRVDMTTADSLTPVFRSFSGEGSKISILWDGTDASGGQISPQVIGYRFYELGAGAEPAPPPGGGGGSPPTPGGNEAMAASGEGEAALFPSSPMEAMAAGQTSYFAMPAPLPPVKKDGEWVPWEEVFGPLPLIEVQITQEQQEEFLARLSEAASGASANGGEAGTPLGPEADPNTPVFSAFWHLKRLGTMGVLSQGHHPRTGSYPTPSRGPGLGNVRMSSARQFGPWGPLAAPGIIAADCLIGFPSIGYEVLIKNSDDFCSPADLRKTSSGGSNTLNQVNIGLFTGHSVAGRDMELSIGYLQSYVPIYNKAANTMTFVKSSEMTFGSPNLKWMAFYSCNLFRDGTYRSDGVYEQMKSHLAVPMNSQLHVLQGYATEMSVHPDMIVWWTRALSKHSPLPSQHTVLGAWKYVCLETQPVESSNPNVSRSIYWPQCSGDYIYGWGPQTDPSGGGQGNLQEDDQQR